MFPSALISAVRRSVVSRRIFSPRAGLSGCLLAVWTALIVCVLAGAPLQAQTAHYGAVLTLGTGFTTPTGVSVDRFGNVFVADNGSSTVKEILAVNGMIPPSPVINTLGSGFSNPFTVTVDGNGNVFLSDYGHKQVKEIVAVNGVIPPSPTIRVLGGGFSFIFGTAVDARGDVFVTDYGHNQVKELVAVNGVVPTSPKILVLGSGFNIPAGVAVDSSGNVFVGDQNNNVVKEILASSGYTTTNIVATGFSTDDGIAIDQHGNVFVADDGNNLVKEIVAVNGVIPPSPTILTLSSPAGGDFLQPFDVAVDPKGNVYVADRGHNAVKEILMGGPDFGSINIGATAPAPATLSFTFDTAGTLGSIAVVTNGNSGRDFYNAGGGTCVPNTLYNVGDVCTINVGFGPLAPGPRYGAAELRNTSGALLASGPLQGVGVGPQSTFGTIAGGASFPASQFGLGSGFVSPGGVAVDAVGNVFVADSSNGAVKEILASGGWTTVNTIGGATYPNGVALDGAGNVYVADTFNDTVKEFVATASGYASGINLGTGLSDPYAVAVDAAGDVFVADFSNGAIKEIVPLNGSISASTNTRTLVSGQQGPDGVAVDGKGNVFFANYGDGTIHEILAVNGSIPATPTILDIAGGLNGPSNVAVDGIGNLFVTDTYDNWIVEFLSAGGYTILGSGFSSPESIAVTTNGSVVVADTGNNAITMMDYADQPALNFATTPVGLTSSDSPQTVSVSNDGNAPLIFPVPGAGNNPNVPANFVWDPSSTCVQTSPASPQAFQLAGGAACTMAFDFKPTAGGILSSNAILTDNDLNISNDTQAIQLIGNGTLPAALTAPIPNTVLAGPKVTFTWSAATGATAYSLRIGTTVGGNNLVSTGLISGTTATPPNLPTNGEKVYARLTTVYGAQQVFKDYTYTAATAAALTAPSPNSVLVGPKVTFSWSAAPGSTGYVLTLGTSVGANNLYGSGTITATSVAPANLPTNGSTIFARLTTVYGGVQVHTDYTFTAATQSALTVPAPNSVLSGAKVTFSWTTAPGATGYGLRLGTAVGGNDLYATGVITGTTATPANLPTNGETIHARLFTVYGSTQVWADYVYTAAP